MIAVLPKTAVILYPNWYNQVKGGGEDCTAPESESPRKDSKHNPESLRVLNH
jgi:hypothetical protein